MQFEKSLIQELLARQKLTQSELARMLQVKRGTVSNIISGRRGMGRKVIAGIMRAFPEESLKGGEKA